MTEMTEVPLGRSHQKLLTKLEGYGISGGLLAWLKAFIPNRTHAVNVNDSLSDVGI